MPVATNGDRLCCRCFENLQHPTYMCDNFDMGLVAVGLLPSAQNLFVQTRSSLTSLHGAFLRSQLLTSPYFFLDCWETTSETKLLLVLRRQLQMANLARTKCLLHVNRHNLRVTVTRTSVFSVATNWT